MAYNKNSGGGECTTKDQSISGTVKVKYSEVENPSTSMKKVGNLADVDHGNTPNNKYWPGSRKK